MSGPERVLAVAGRPQSASGTTGAPEPVATGSGPAQAAGAVRGAGPVATGTFDATLASASGGPVNGAWTIPWADGTTPVQTLRPAARVGATRFAMAGATPAGASPVASAGATAGFSAYGTVDPLAVTSPVDGRLTQDFGPTASVYSAPATVNGVHYDHFHDGVDFGAELGSPVRAMASGVVEFAGRYPDGAVVVKVRHADGSTALYAHLAADLDVRAGDRVAAGDRLGVVGMTGNTTGPHLHLELTVGGRDVDPLPVLAAGRLPGAADGSLDTSVLPSAAVSSTTSAALARFDAVADGIPYAAEIRAAATAAGIDPLLLASLVRTESSFHADAVSRCGALGLCQLMPANAKALGVTDPFDPAQNLRAGARYFARNLQIYGRVDVALAAYQAGKGAVAAAGGGIPNSPTTRHYVNRVLHTWAGYMEAAA